MARKQDFFGENKNRRNIRVTDTAWNGLTAIASLLRISVSQLFELAGRGSLSKIVADKPEKNVDILILYVHNKEGKKQR